MMAHKKSDRIPILKTSAYYREYFKRGAENDGFRNNMPEPYVEIGNRCMWSDAIDPHRLDFYIIFLTTEGTGTQTLGLNEYAVAENRLGFIGPNVISAWRSESKTQRGYFIAFSEEFYASLNHRRVLSQLPFFQLDGESVPEVDESFLQNVLEVLEQIEGETGKSIPQIALNWQLGRETVSNIVIGARNEQQLMANIGACGWSLSEEHRNLLDEVSEQKKLYPHWVGMR